MQVYCEELCRAGKGPQALWLVKQTSTVLNHSACLMYMLGSVHYVLHRPMDALAFFAAAVAAKPDCWEAREALENLKAAACDRWHFRMLNDGERNAAYAAALRVARGRTVLDIGTGTGLLAMYAARAGATSVVACDINPIMCRLVCVPIESTYFGPKPTHCFLRSLPPYHATSSSLPLMLPALPYPLMLTAAFTILHLWPD